MNTSSPNIVPSYAAVHICIGALIYACATCIYIYMCSISSMLLWSLRIDRARNLTTWDGICVAFLCLLSTHDAHQSDILGDPSESASEFLGCLHAVCIDSKSAAKIFLLTPPSSSGCLPCRKYLHVGDKIGMTSSKVLHKAQFTYLRPRTMSPKYLNAASRTQRTGNDEWVESQRGTVSKLLH